MEVDANLLTEKIKGSKSKKVKVFFDYIDIVLIREELKYFDYIRVILYNEI
jgi:hypothetical protein